MRVTDIIRRKGSAVVTLPPDASITELVATLYERRIGAVVIVEGGSLVGIASERDVVRHLHTDGDTGATVRAIMSTPVVTCEPDDELQELATVMTRQRLRHLPVLRDGRVIAIVSIGDVVKGRLDELEAERDHLTQYITG